MTVSTMTTVHAYVGDGVQQEWPVLFPFFSPEDVRAIRTGTDGADALLVHGSDYTVTALESGGRCTCPLGSGERLTLFLDLAPVQQIDLSNTGILAPEIIERGFDRLTLIAQQLKEEVGRCVQTGRTSGLTPNELLASIDSGVAACMAAQAASGQSAAGAATARDEAAASAMASAAAAASVALPVPDSVESGRALVVAPEGGWTLGGTAAAKNVGTGPGDVPTNADITIPAAFSGKTQAIVSAPQEFLTASGLEVSLSSALTVAFDDGEGGAVKSTFEADSITLPSSDTAYYIAVEQDKATGAKSLAAYAGEMYPVTSYARSTTQDDFFVKGSMASGSIAAMLDNDWTGVATIINTTLTASSQNRGAIEGVIYRKKRRAPLKMRLSAGTGAGTTTYYVVIAGSNDGGATWADLVWHRCDVNITAGWMAIKAMPANYLTMTYEYDLIKISLVNGATAGTNPGIVELDVQEGVYGESDVAALNYNVASKQWGDGKYRHIIGVATVATGAITTLRQAATLPFAVVLVAGTRVPNPWIYLPYGVSRIPDAFVAHGYSTGDFLAPILGGPATCYRID